MSEEASETPSDVSLSVSIDEMGVSAHAKSRAISAIDDLIGAGIGLIATPLSGIKNRMRARDEVREALIREEGNLALKALSEIGGIGERAARRWISAETRKQDNLEAVAFEAVEAMKALPPPPQASEVDRLEDDWINVFGKYAENASSDRLRELWGRILAGEIRTPGAFSLRTLNFISQLDRETAVKFQEFVKERFNNNKFLPYHIRKGHQLLDFRFMDEAGLILSAEDLSMPMEPLKDGYCYRPERGMAIRVIAKEVPVRVRFHKITQVGVEICSILPEEPPEVALRAIYETIADQCDRAEIVRLESNRGFDFSVVEILKGD